MSELLKNCKICKKQFNPKSNGQLYCTYDCRRIVINKNRRLFYSLHREQELKQMKIYRETHKEQIVKRQKKNNKINKIKFNIYRKNKKKTDINYRISEILRKRMWKVLKNNTKSTHTIKLLGCSLEFLRQHLEKQFTVGMSWSNYGKWHIDHIRPCASFDLSKPEEQRKCFNYTNLQPLWAEENLSKGKKLKLTRKNS